MDPLIVEARAAWHEWATAQRRDQAILACYHAGYDMHDLAEAMDPPTTRHTLYRILRRHGISYGRTIQTS